MANIIMLREKLTFGKHEGLMGSELMKSGTGTNYLAWVYNNTDIQIEDCIVNSLVANGFVVQKPNRHNSRGIDTGANIGAMLSIAHRVMADASAHQAFHRVRADSIKDSPVFVLPSYKDAIGKRVRVQLNTPELKPDREINVKSKLQGQFAGQAVGTVAEKLINTLSDKGISYVFNKVVNAESKGRVVHIETYIREAIGLRLIGKNNLANVSIRTDRAKCNHCREDYTKKNDDQKYCCKPCKEAAYRERVANRKQANVRRSLSDWGEDFRKMQAEMSEYGQRHENNYDQHASRRAIIAEGIGKW